MLARCARCQGTFTTDRFGRQFCPHCGSELILADPGAPGPSQPPATPPADPGWDAAQPPPAAPPGGEPPPPVFPPPPAAGGGWAPPPPPPPPDETPAPFAERGQRGFVGAFFATWKLVAVDPQRFFANVRIDQIGPAILFGFLAAFVGGLAAVLFGTVANMSSIATLQSLMGKMPPEMADLYRQVLPLLGGGMVAAQIILLPIAIFIRMFVAAGIVHLLLMMFGGAARGFGATLTVVAYTFGLQLLTAVPMCGWLIAFVWQAVALIIGLAAVHRAETWKSAVAVIAPIVLCCCCLLAGLGSVMMAIAGAANGSVNL